MVAKNTKALMTGNDHLFTASVDDESDKASSGGWGMKVPLPARLETRYKGTCGQSIYRVFLFCSVFFFLVVV
jgi:hypothetical protein